LRRDGKGHTPAAGLRHGTAVSVSESGEPAGPAEETEIYTVIEP